MRVFVKNFDDAFGVLPDCQPSHGFFLHFNIRRYSGGSASCSAEKKMDFLKVKCLESHSPFAEYKENFDPRIQCHPLFALVKWQGDMAKEVAEKRTIFLNVINASVPTLILKRLLQVTLEIFEPDLRPGSINTRAHMRVLNPKLQECLDCHSVSTARKKTSKCMSQDLCCNSTTKICLSLIEIHDV